MDFEAPLGDSLVYRAPVVMFEPAAPRPKLGSVVTFRVDDETFERLAAIRRSGAHLSENVIARYACELGMLAIQQTLAGQFFVSPVVLLSDKIAKFLAWEARQSEARLDVPAL